jgi:hypothetical protein
MTEKEIETVDDAKLWLRACSLYLADADAVSLNRRSCAKLSRAFARVARLLGEERPRRTAHASGSDFIAFAASGGPPPLPAKMHAVPPGAPTPRMPLQPLPAHAQFVPLPEAGANVVALLPAAARCGDGTS